MEHIPFIIAFIYDHWPLVVGLASSVYLLLSAYVRSTETKEDDIWLRRWVDKLSFLSALGEMGTFKMPGRNSRNDQ